MKNSRFFIIFILFITINFCFAERLNDKVWKIKESGKLNIATLNFDYYPWIYTDDDGDLKGLDILLIEELAKSLNVKPVYHRICSSYTDMLKYVNSDSIDIGIGILSKSLNRELNSLQTNPYFGLEMKVLIDRVQSSILKNEVLDDNVISMINNKNVNLGIVSPSWYVDFCKRKIPDATLVHYLNSDAMLEGLLTKEVDAVLTHDVDMKFFFDDHSERQLYYEIHTIPYIDRLCMQVNRNKPELKNIVNVFLKSNQNPYLKYRVKEALNKYILNKKNINTNFVIKKRDNNLYDYFIFFSAFAVWLFIFLILKKLKFSLFTQSIILYGGVSAFAIFSGLYLTTLTKFVSSLNHFILLFITFFVLIMIFSRIVISYQESKDSLFKLFIKIIFYISIFSISFIIFGFILSQLIFDESMINKINFNSSSLNILSQSTKLKSVIGDYVSLRFLPLLFLLISFLIAHATFLMSKGQNLIFNLASSTYNLTYKIVHLFYKVLPLLVFSIISNYALFYVENYTVYSLFLVRSITICIILAIILLGLIASKINKSFIETFFILKKTILIGCTTGIGIIVYPELIKKFKDNKNISLNKFKLSLPIFFIMGNSIFIMAIIFTLFGAMSLYDMEISFQTVSIIFAISFLMVFVLGGIFTFNSIAIASLFFASVISVPQIGILSVFGMVFNTLLPFITVLHILITLYCSLSVSQSSDDELDDVYDKEFDNFYKQKTKKQYQR